MEYRAFNNPLLGAEHICLSKMLAKIVPYSQAWHMHKDFVAGTLTPESIENTLTAEKPNQKETLKLPLERIQKFLPNADKKQLEDYVMKACEYYNKVLQRQKNRNSRDAR